MLGFKHSLGCAALATAGALALAAPAAHADIMGQLTVANANLATQGSGPYASYDIAGVGTAGPGSTFTEFTATFTGLNNFVFGDGGIAALNLSTAAGAGTLVSGTITLSVSPGGGQEDGFGMFNFQLDDGNGFSSPHSSFSFTFTTANAVSLANLLDTTLPDVAGHMALATNTACTGFAANGGTGSGTVDNTACTPTNRVPEPASLAIFGTALAGMGLLGRRRRKSV